MTAERLKSDSGIGVVTPDMLRLLSGLHFMQRIADGRLPAPPIAALLGFHPAEVESGRAVFVATPDVRHYNPIGSVHGGYAATLVSERAKTRP